MVSKYNGVPTVKLLGVREMPMIGLGTYAVSFTEIIRCNKCHN